MYGVLNTLLWDVVAANVVWLVTVGWALALGHLMTAIFAARILSMLLVTHLRHMFTQTHAVQEACCSFLNRDTC
jgi:uncharacterized membrane protein YccF (DUF307 family)